MGLYEQLLIGVSKLVLNLSVEVIRGIALNTDLVPRVGVSRVVLDHVETDISLAVLVSSHFVAV